MNRVLVLALCLLLGCSSDYGEPYLSPGPSPTAGRGSLFRFEQTKTDFAMGEIDRTLWGIGDDIREPAEWIECLIDKLPKSVVEKLTTDIPANGDDQIGFPVPAFYADATILTVEPHLMVVVRENRRNQYPFNSGTVHLDDRDRLQHMRDHREIVATRFNNRIRFYAGDLFPFDEMLYWVGCGDFENPKPLNMGLNTLRYDGGEFKLQLTRDGDDVLVQID